MPIPASPVPLRAAGEGFQPRDLAGLALLCARAWGVPRAAVMERLERTDWEEAEHRLSQRRPVSLDLGTVDLLASRTFRSGLGASRPDPGSPVPGHLFCGVRPLGDGRMEAAMAACPDRAFLSGHPEYRTCGAVTLSACGIPGILGPALHRRLDLDLGPMKAAPRDAVSRLPAWCTEENFAGTAALILSAVAVNGHPVFSGSPADRLRNLRENRLDGVFHISSARAAAGAIRGFGTDPAEIRPPTIRALTKSSGGPAPSAPGAAGPCFSALSAQACPEGKTHPAVPPLRQPSCSGRRKNTSQKKAGPPRFL